MSIVRQRNMDRTIDKQFYICVIIFARSICSIQCQSVNFNDAQCTNCVKTMLNVQIAPLRFAIESIVMEETRRSKLVQQKHTNFGIISYNIF